MDGRYSISVRPRNFTHIPEGPGVIFRKVDFFLTTVLKKRQEEKVDFLKRFIIFELSHHESFTCG